MANIIDRDPEKIIQYTQNVGDSIEVIRSKLKTLINYLDGFVTDLNDKNCHVLFKELEINGNKAMACLDRLLTENDEIESEAKILKLKIDEGFGGYTR